MTYGFSESADFRAANVRVENGMTKYECLYRDKSLGDVSLGILGRHNALNSLSAVAVAMDLGLDFKTIREGLSSFRGVGRRMERVGEAGGVLVMDDYGHHPTEIRATLDALSSLGRRLVVVCSSRTVIRGPGFYGRSSGSVFRARTCSS